MTTRFFSLILLFITCAGTAQNLVPNHSFEEFVDGCTESLNEMPIYWEKWRESPNSFSTCVIPQNFSDSLRWAPWNGFGYQWPADGDSYVGLYACGPPGFSQNFREYLGCELLEPLQVGDTYYVSFKTSMGFTGNYYNVTYACNRMGAYFTTQGYHWSNTPLEIPNFAHVYGSSIIADTVNWVTIEGSFVADQPYTHLGLGVFFEFDSLDVLQLVPGSSLGGYYYIDDVCVSRFPDCTNVTSTFENSSLPDVLIYPNPANYRVFIVASENIESIGLMDTSGNWVVMPSKESRPKVEWNLSGLSSGVYILDVRTATGVKREKLVIVH